jgi:Holliday junction DNA helicase RuvB
MLSAPLRSRFGINERLEFYTDEELQIIVMQNAHFLHLEIQKDAALLIGSCARGTPRIAKKIIRRVRDFAQVSEKKIIDLVFTQQALSFLGINEEGLTKIDVAIIRTIIEHFKGGPVGLETIASFIGEDSDTLETVYEPFLLRKGYLEKTPRGRQIPHIKIPQFMKKFLGQTYI